MKSRGITISTLSTFQMHFEKNCFNQGGYYRSITPSNRVKSRGITISTFQMHFEKNWFNQGELTQIYYSLKLRKIARYYDFHLLDEPRKKLFYSRGFIVSITPSNRVKLSGMTICTLP